MRICKFYELTMKKFKTIHYSIIPIMFCLGAIFAFVSLPFFGIFELSTVFLLLFVLASFLLSILFKGFLRLTFSFLLGAALGFIRGQAYHISTNTITTFQKQELVAEASIDSDPIIKNGTLRFESTKLILINKSLEVSCPSYFSLSLPDIELTKSDKVLIKGKSSGGFGKYCTFFNKPEILKISKPDPPDLFLKFRDWFSSIFIKIIDRVESDASNASALGLGYLTGQKRYMSDVFNESLRRAGLSHIVVASGFHLAIVVSFARKYFSKISRFACLLGAILLVFIFVSVAGLGASMLRAAVLTLFSLLAWYFGRKFHPMRAILYVASLSLFVNPGYITDLAWQLSFASYLGIIFIAPLFLDYFYGNDTPGFIMNTCLQPISAQLLCLPISIYNFGAFSVVGLISNILIPPSIPIAMLLSLLCVFFSWMPLVSDILAFLTKSLLELHVHTIDFLSKLSWASKEITSGDSRILLLYLVPAVIFLILKLATRHSFHPYRPTPLARAKLEKS